MFWAEAAKYNVLPLDDRFAERGDPTLRPSLIEGRTQFTYFAGAERIPESSSPNVKNKSHVVTATIDLPGDGVLVAAGGTVGGYTLFVKDRRPTYEYNWFGQQRYRITFKFTGAINKIEVDIATKFGALEEQRRAAMEARRRSSDPPRVYATSVAFSGRSSAAPSRARRPSAGRGTDGRIAETAGARKKSRRHGQARRPARPRSRMSARPRRR